MNRGPSTETDSISESCFRASAIFCPISRGFCFNVLAKAKALLHWKSLKSGLSEGFTATGFHPIAHVEMNKEACTKELGNIALETIDSLGEFSFSNNIDGKGLNGFIFE